METSVPNRMSGKSSSAAEGAAVGEDRGAARAEDAYLRIARSVLSPGVQLSGLDEFRAWWDGVTAADHTVVRHIPFDRLERWTTEPGTGDIRHDSGGFFSVVGLDVQIEGAPVTHWQQPIIDQPEVGILGLLVKEFDGVLHGLMQAKIEPGNRNGLQLAPTVQATRSNYSRLHGGNPVPYLDYFRDAARHHVLADVRQSEQGSWFDGKRNRNMVIETTEDVPLLERFCWLSIGQIHQLLAEEDLINMDARTVLSCLPIAGAGVAEVLPAEGDFGAALVKSCESEAGSLHRETEVLSWITEQRTRCLLRTRRLPLAGLSGWRRTDDEIAHESGLFFSITGVRVRSEGREVRQWCQPMLKPSARGLIAFLVRQFDGVLHVLVHARLEAGFVDVVELGPTVQCTPENYTQLPECSKPPFLDEVLDASPERIRYDTVLSEEGGRFYHALNRYVVVETDEHLRPPPEYRWLTLHQLVGLLRHSHYVNVQARSLIACLHSLVARDV